MIVRWYGLALLAMGGVSISPVHAATSDSLVGLWSTELTFGPAIEGELRVTRRGEHGEAAIAGRRVTVAFHGDSARFELPGNAAGFRGAVVRDGTAIEGFWIQRPAGSSDTQDRSGTGQPHATPTVLRREASGPWRGTVRALPAKFTLYLRVYRNPQGTLVGAFRNPQANSNGGASIFRVVPEGDSVWFSIRPDPEAPEMRLGAAWVRNPERLRLAWPDVGGTLDLARRTPSEVANFFPRPPGDTTYVYRRPAETKDGWVTARVRDVGLDEAGLTRLVHRLIVSDPSAPRAPLVHSLLVARRGRLVLEEYFFGYDRERPHDIRSAGKTFASVMLGAVMMRGAPIGPDTPVYRLLARPGSSANPDERKSRITLAHLLTHTSGLACDDNDDASPGNEWTMQTQTREPDWWKYTMDLPLAHDPGTRYAYASAGTNLVGAALTAATGTWLPELFERTIARPLQFGPHYWNLMPTDEGYLGGGAYLRPRDLLKVGQVYLDGGVWHGVRIVDSTWVETSTSPKVHISPATTGLAPEEFGNFYGEGDDAYAWHRSRIQAGERTYDAYNANGNGGQLLVVVPEAEMAVVLTGGNYGQGGIWTRWLNQIVGEGILTALRE